MNSGLPGRDAAFVIPDVSKEHNFFIFKCQADQEEFCVVRLDARKMQALRSFGTLKRPTQWCSVTLQNTWAPQQHHHGGNLKYRVILSLTLQRFAESILILSLAENLKINCDVVCTVYHNQLYKQNQQDALSVCIYFTIFVHSNSWWWTKWSFETCRVVQKL